jgi:siroheme synthase-like protein
MSALPYYPIQIRLSGKPVLVAGAGRVATRKIERLVACGARVTVVAREASAPVRHLAEAGKLTLNLRDVVPDDAREQLLVIAATDDTSANAVIAESSRILGIMVSRTDAPEESDFILPAIAQGEHVAATVSTRGNAPSASRRLGRELVRWISAGPDRFAGVVAEARRTLRGQPDAGRRLKRLAEGDLFDACMRADEALIEELLHAVVAGPLSVEDDELTEAPS